MALRAPDGRARFVEVDLRLPRARQGAAIAEVASAWLEPAEPAGGATGIGLLEAVLLALLGGLILNLMPCVLPVLAIKAFSIAELADKSRREVVQHGFAYAAGVLATMAALAATVVALRAAGIAVGWGFQFQEPLFIAAIGAVLLVFALNLFGVFEIFIDATALDRVSAGATGLRQSFFEGENLRTVAIARLLLDNLPHCKAFWIMHTLELAQVMLQNGADDIDGTVVWYDITKVASPSTHQEATVWDLQRAIREAGFRPIERDTLYRPIERDGNDWQLAATV